MVKSFIVTLQKKKKKKKIQKTSDSFCLFKVEILPVDPAAVSCSLTTTNISMCRMSEVGKDPRFLISTYISTPPLPLSVDENIISRDNKSKGRATVESEGFALLGPAPEAGRAVGPVSILELQKRVLSTKQNSLKDR